MRTLFIGVAVILMLDVGCFSQGLNPMTELVSGPDWKQGLVTGKISGWLYYSDIDMSERLASSSLLKYPAFQVNDGSPKTAWATTNELGGVGEVIVMDFQKRSTIWWIWSGNGKSSAAFLSGNRPKRIKIFLVGSFCNECTSNMCVVGNFVVVNSVEVELQDVNDFQMLRVPERFIVDNSVACNGVGGKNSNPENYVFKLGIQILSIYKGTDSNNTFISEVMDHASYTNWLMKK